MADASQYPVTLGYKATTPPYGTALRPYHKGIDYGCPAGTPVVVNGVQIGLSGATGFVTGAHLHVGRFVNGADTNPAGGFKFNSAVVTEIGYDINNGNFVRLQADGASWVYCHLNSTNVTKGQVLKGEDMPNQGDVVNVFKDALGREPSDGEIKAYTASTWNNLYYSIYGSKEYLQGTYVNDGDTQNLFSFFAGRDASKADKDYHRGKKFKPTAYNLMQNPDVIAHQGNNYEVVNEPLFRKKK